MCRNKKELLSLLLGCVVLLSGCSMPGLVTDTGSGKQQTIVKEDYLNTSLLEEEENGTKDEGYKVIELTKGTFEEEALQQTLGRSFLNIPTVNYTLEGRKAQFGEYLVSYMDYVEKGDPIASVYTDVDQVSIEQIKIRINRLEERYAKALKEHEEEIEKRNLERKNASDKYEYKILSAQFDQCNLDWENEKYYYEKDLQEAKDELAKLTQIGSIYTVKAPESGYVYFANRLTTGKELKAGDYIAHILDNGDVYVVTENQADRFGYGMEVEFSSRGGNASAMVINAGPKALYGNLDTGVATFLLHFDVDVSTLNQTTLNNLVLKGNVSKVENVIVVPKYAVTEENGKYYVTVLLEDGSLCQTQFVPGGFGMNQMWVLEGLSEGTKIVYN